MGTILNDAANSYPLFFQNDTCSEDMVRSHFDGWNNAEEREKFIISFYDILFNSSVLNNVSRIYVKTRMQYSEVATYFNRLYKNDIEAGHKKLKNSKNVKADISFCNKKLTNVLSYGNKTEDNYFHLIMHNNVIDNETWKKINEVLEQLKVSYCKSLLDENKFLLNIPIASYCKEITDEDFDSLLELIKPYFINQRSIIQKEVNKRKENIGYLNYILSAKAELTEVDKERLNKVVELMTPTQKHRVLKVTDKVLLSLEKDINRYQKRIDVYIEENDKNKREALEKFKEIALTLLKGINIETYNIQKEVVDSISGTYGDCKKLNKKVNDINGLIKQQQELLNVAQQKYIDRQKEIEKKKKKKIEKQVEKEWKEKREQEIMNEESQFDFNDDVISYN